MPGGRPRGSYCWIESPAMPLSTPPGPRSIAPAIHAQGCAVTRDAVAKRTGRFMAWTFDVVR